MQEEQDIGVVEQGVRLVGGQLTSLAGIALLIPDLATLLTGVLGVMLVSLGLYLFVTGATGYCPIYHRLGWTLGRVEGERDDAAINQWRRMNHEGRVRDGWKHRALMILCCLPMIVVVAWISLRTWGS